ncbi:DEAD/DEAH box helicase [Methanolobus profundi]|uniref:DEAD/DEAH box helicase domain-containing protein n=1 Tax=Methanolobus profundi TaxID=487685 RepID=A0A1I4P1U9_9EURY|nr:DEAD/DEAH box helicase [Methanolobus profundi]SFM21742.1 DEAD/DEAH box helicase domain-containing protein [Methanolobus profundi]
MDISQLIEMIRSSRRYEGQISHIEDLPGREAEFRDAEINPLIRYALSENGIDKLYAHQAEAVELARQRKNIVLSTSTASGKSMCYMLPIFERLLEEPHATALYISPLNALVNDQLDTFRKLSHTMGLSVNIDRFVGSMTKSEKDTVKYGNTKIIFTNPEMLHLSFLQWKHQWKYFLSNLNFIILDESHSYSGVMGSHMGNLLRRLNRVCEHYGSNPQYICCTATIGNPVAHSSALTGKDLTLIDNDSSGQGPQKFIFWNPPLYSKSNNFTRRKASFGETVDLFTTFVQSDLQTIAFARSRQKVERMYVQAKNTLAERGGEERISPYRGGYHGDERETIEKELAQGNIDGVISTNALELGIDIGGLDACIMDGFPGTIMSARQQAGRAGRGSRESIVALVADSNALDQYYMRNPQDFFRRKCEEAVVNVSNRYIQAGHLLCAAKELPLRAKDSEFFGPEFDTIVKVLEEEDLLEGINEKRSLDPNPHMRLSIRSIDNNNYTIIDKATRKPLEKDIERLRAYREAFEGAVYINKGTPYCVTKLDHGKKEIHVEKAQDGYYTRSLVSSDIVVREVVDTKPLGTYPDVKVGFGDVDVTQQVTGYKKFQQRTDTELGNLPLDMPEFKLETEALWLELPFSFTELVSEYDRDLAGGIHAIEHAMIAMYPLHLLADRNDVGGVSTPEHADLSHNTGIFVYDGHPGGVGYAESGYEKIVEMLEVTLRSIESCPCLDGCPSCIQSPKCGNNNSPLDKDAAIMILRKMLNKPAYIPEKRKVVRKTERPGQKETVEPVQRKPEDRPFDHNAALNRARRKLRQRDRKSVSEWIQEGVQAGREKNRELAYECFEAALQLQPSNATALMNKGITCLHLGQNQMALTCFNKLIGMGYAKSVVWKHKGIALHRLGDFNGAVEMFDKALTEKPDDAKLQELRKKSFEKMGQ